MGESFAAISPDFKQLAISFVRDGVPNVWSSSLTAAGPDPHFIQLTREQESGAFADWSPDGRWLAYQCDAGTNTHICVIPAAGGVRVQLSNDEGVSWLSGWIDNDKILVTAHRNAVWNVAWISRSTKVMHVLAHLTQPRSFVRYARWDPVNRRVVFEHSDITGRVWTVQLPPRR